MTDARQEAKRNNIKLLKEANKILVLQCIMKLAPISTEEILKHTGLSRPTVINLLKELTDEEIVTKAGFSESSGGRSAALLALNGEKHFALGIDFEFPAVRMAIANMKAISVRRKALSIRRALARRICFPIFCGVSTALLGSRGSIRHCWMARGWESPRDRQHQRHFHEH